MLQDDVDDSPETLDGWFPPAAAKWTSGGMFSPMMKVISDRRFPWPSFSLGSCLIILSVCLEDCSGSQACRRTSVREDTQSLVWKRSFSVLLVFC